MKRLLSILLGSFLISLVLMYGCRPGKPTGSYIPRTGKVMVKPVDDIKRNFQYCRYEVTGPPSKGPAGIKKGEFICVKCPVGRSGCDAFSKIELGDGQVYPVKSKDKGLACTSCPASTANPPGYPFEEQ